MDTETEMFIVTKGSARIIVDGETFHLGKGEGKTDFLVTVGGSHGLFDKSEDFHCVIVLLDSNPNHR